MKKRLLLWWDWATCMTCRGHICLAKAKWDMEKGWRGHVWTSDFILSFCLRGSEWGEEAGGGGVLLDERENNSASASNWNLRRTKSVFHVCMQLLPKGSTHLLPSPLSPSYCPWSPPPTFQTHRSLIPPETTIPTNDYISCASLTTLHFTIYRGEDNLLIPPYHY